MKHFMSNPCGYGHCMEWECEKCSHFNPYFYSIKVPKWLGKLLYNLEEYINLKKWVKEHPKDENGRGEF